MRQEVVRKYPVVVRFSKCRELVFISHLDLMRLFLRTFRRARLPLYYTQGFNVHPKLSFARALSLGVASSVEVMTFYCTRMIDLAHTRAQLNTLLPKGVRINQLSYEKEK